MKRIERIIKNNILIQKLYIVFGTLFFRFIGIFVPIKTNQILFVSMSGNNYEFSSPFILYNRIKEIYGDKYTYIWAFSKEKIKKIDEKKVCITSFRYFIEVLRSKIWITDVNIERGLRLKRKKQYYVNTWHGGLSKGYPSKRKDYNLGNVNIFCSDSEAFEAFFIKHYKVKQESFLRVGRPREDLIPTLLSKRDVLRKEMGFEKTDYIILYMPTWRETKNEYYIDFNSIVKEIPNSIILYHAHNLSDANPILNSRQIVDVSLNNNLNVLYVCADLLISDYSSCINDFLLTGHPAVLYAPDYEAYKSTRGLAVDYKNEFPLGISQTTDSLIQKINFLRANDISNEFHVFLDKIVNKKSNATQSIIDKMLEDKVLI